MSDNYDDMDENENEREESPEHEREEEERDILAEAKTAFELAIEAESENRDAAEDDLRFARLDDQWPEEIRRQRERDRRPVLTANLLPAFIRQVVNDARQNKPSIKTHPVDSGADVKTAEIINGLIRNIEYTSDAEIAYDTATEYAVSMGWGYIKVDVDYAHDETFDMDIRIERVANPFSIYGDPFSTAADSSDWNSAFETEWMTEDEFKREFPGEEPSDWVDSENAEHWINDNQYLVAKWWQREEERRIVYKLSDGRIIDQDDADEELGDGWTRLALYEMGFDPDTGMMMEPAYKVSEREMRNFRVRRHTLTAGKVLKTEDWPGKYIPIIPVYGDDLIDERGVRHLRSLIRGAKDAQRMFNYWRSSATELVALAPRVPFIGEEGTFSVDARRWATANSENHPYLEYKKGSQPPQRQPLDTGAAAGALQEASNAAADIKSIIGINDPAMGVPNNETSGRAILARQRESDVSTFHFQDNMSRAIRHVGRILIDLIPHFYSNDRIIRVIGEDGKDTQVQLGKPMPETDDNGQPMTGPDGNPIMRVYDLSLGKYDLTVTTGPSYSTQREEAREQIVMMAQAYPPLMQVAGDIIARNMDWPGADELAKRLKTMLPPQLNGGLPAEVQQMIDEGKAQIMQQGETIKQMTAYIAKLEADRTNDAAKVQVDRYEAETDRMEALAKMQQDANAPVNVPDAGPGPYADYEGIVAAANAKKAMAVADRESANAEMARMKAMRESMTPVQTPYPPTPTGFDNGY